VEQRHNHLATRSLLPFICPIWFIVSVHGFAKIFLARLAGGLQSRVIHQETKTEATEAAAKIIEQEAKI